jgi:imidazolonepropionase-like amidohydrolase
MTPMETIIASTKTAAECLGWQDKLGTLETGKLADIIIVKGNPLDDIYSLADNETIQVVIKNGKVEKNTLE